MAAPTEEMSKLSIEEEAPGPKKPKGGKKNQKGSKDKGVSSAHRLEVLHLLA